MWKQHWGPLEKWTIRHWYFFIVKMVGPGDGSLHRAWQVSPVEGHNLLFGINGAEVIAAVNGAHKGRIHHKMVRIVNALRRSRPRKHKSGAVCACASVGTVHSQQTIAALTAVVRCALAQGHLLHLPLNNQRNQVVSHCPLVLSTMYELNSCYSLPDGCGTEFWILRMPCISGSELRSFGRLPDLALLPRYAAQG